MTKNAALSLINELTAYILDRRISIQDLESFLQQFRQKEPPDPIIPPEFNLVAYEKNLGNKQTGGNRSAAANLLKISHRALLYRIKEMRSG